MHATVPKDVWCFYSRETLQASADYWLPDRVIALATSPFLLKLAVVDSTSNWLDLRLVGRCPNGTGEAFYRIYARVLNYGQKRALYEAIKKSYGGTNAKFHPKVKVAASTLGISKIHL